MTQELQSGLNERVEPLRTFPELLGAAPTDPSKEFLTQLGALGLMFAEQRASEDVQALRSSISHDYFGYNIQVQPASNRLFSYDGDFPWHTTELSSLSLPAGVRPYEKQRPLKGHVVGILCDGSITLVPSSLKSFFFTTRYRVFPHDTEGEAAVDLHLGKRERVYYSTESGN